MTVSLLKALRESHEDFQSGHGDSRVFPALLLSRTDVMSSSLCQGARWRHSSKSLSSHKRQHDTRNQNQHWDAPRFAQEDDGLGAEWLKRDGCEKLWDNNACDLPFCHLPTVTQWLRWVFCVKDVLIGHFIIKNSFPCRNNRIPGGGCSHWMHKYATASLFCFIKAQPCHYMYYLPKCSLLN